MNRDRWVGEEDCTEYIHKLVSGGESGRLDRGNKWHGSGGLNLAELWLKGLKRAEKKSCDATQVRPQGLPLITPLHATSLAFHTHTQHAPTHVYLAFHPVLQR